MEILTTQTFKVRVFDFEKNSEWQYQGSRPAVIDFYADWCGPCHALAPILDEVAAAHQGEIDFYKIDTEASPELAALFEVRGIPAILFIPPNGELVMTSGFMPRESFDRAIADVFGIKR